MPALADVLPDFGLRPGAGGASVALEPGPVPPSVDPQAERRQAIAQAVADAEAALAERLGSEHAEQLAAERARHAEEMETALKRFGEEAGAAISARFAQMEREVVSLTSALAARVLGAALSEDLQTRAVGELARIVRAAVRDREAVRARVSGNPLLCEALRARLGEHATQVDFIEAPGFDLTAQIDESLFETRLAEWSDALSELLS